MSLIVVLNDGTKLLKELERCGIAAWKVLLEVSEDEWSWPGEGVPVETESKAGQGARVCVLFVRGGLPAGK